MAEQSTCVRVEPAEPERAHSSSTDTKLKSLKKPTGWNSFFHSVAVSLICISRNIRAFSARIKRLFGQSLIRYCFLVFCIVPQPDVKEQLGKEEGIGQVSKVVGNMWKKLPTDRRKIGYELRTLRMFVYYPALFQ